MPFLNLSLFFQKTVYIFPILKRMLYIEGNEKLFSILIFSKATF